jgi:hypothetical protein
LRPGAVGRREDEDDALEVGGRLGLAFLDSGQDMVESIR